jgi:hypothetical protein
MLELISEVCLKISLEIIAERVVKKDLLDFIMMLVSLSRRVLIL